LRKCRWLLALLIFLSFIEVLLVEVLIKLKVAIAETLHQALHVHG
jgi:hypothetical protein